MSVYNTKPDEYNQKLAEALAKLDEFKMPEWAHYVKTSVSKQRPPEGEYWWHKRAASILRQIFIKGVVGVNRLKTRYGGRKSRGAKPERFKKGSGKIIRTILQMSEKAGFLVQSDTKKKGRQLTKKGLEFLNKIGEGK
ncbi:MAG: 40S ribosomal protein S19 [Candidatus Pacearchaeota archaeon]|nr:40S ribosomal protein S19 [Candidatus Pacearchaeota archaeon]